MRACVITSGQLQDISGAVQSILKVHTLPLVSISGYQVHKLSYATTSPVQALPQGTSVKVLTTSCGHSRDAATVTAWSEDDSMLQEIAARWAEQSGAAVSAGYFPLLVKPVGGPGFELHIDAETRAALAQDMNAAAVNDTAHIRQVFSLPVAESTTLFYTHTYGRSSLFRSVCS